MFTEFAVTRILYTARISNVENTVCDNEERKMVNFAQIEYSTNSHFFPGLKFTIYLSS